MLLVKFSIESIIKLPSKTTNNTKCSNVVRTIHIIPNMGEKEYHLCDILEVVNGFVDLLVTNNRGLQRWPNPQKFRQ